MSLTIDLAPSEEQHLAEQAAQQGVPVSDYARGLLQNSLRQAAREARAKQAARVLRDWIEEARADLSGEPDEVAQREAREWEEAARAVDEDRLSHRRRFAEPAVDASP